MHTGAGNMMISNGTNIKNIDHASAASRLAEVPDTSVLTAEPLAPHTSYKIGGPTAVWVAPRTEEAVGRVLEIIRAADIPLLVLGRGSNVLVSDNGWHGATLYLAENLSGWKFRDLEVDVLAGSRLLDLTRSTVENGLAGLELLAGIPGGVGGALRMNAGAFGREIESVTAAVTGFRRNGSRFRAERGGLNFGYRRAPDLEEVIITSACLRFERSDPAMLRERMNDILAMRAKKQPLQFPSCGSVFKRPAGYYAGALIEEAGLKGHRIGGAMVSRKHAGFILIVADATAVDVYGLIRLIEKKVFDRFGVQLEREVKLIGEFNES
jgi:UDP-N-acetylmuramate dehydrogenase